MHIDLDDDAYLIHFSFYSTMYMWLDMYRM